MSISDYLSRRKRKYIVCLKNILYWIQETCKKSIFSAIEGNLPSIHQLYINSADYETYGENDVVDFIKKFAAPESVFEHKSRLVQKKLEKFYLASNASETRDYKFFLERYTQVSFFKDSLTALCFLVDIY